MKAIKILLFILAVPILAPLMWLSHQADQYWREGKEAPFWYYLLFIFIAPANAVLYVVEEHWEELLD